MDIIENLKNEIFYYDKDKKAVETILKNIKQAISQNFDIEVLGSFEEISEDEPYVMDGDGSLFRQGTTIFYHIKSNLTNENKMIKFNDFTEFVAKNENISTIMANKLIDIFANGFAETCHNVAAFNPAKFGFTVSH